MGFKGSVNATTLHSYHHPDRTLLIKMGKGRLYS